MKHALLSCFLFLKQKQKLLLFLNSTSEEFYLSMYGGKEQISYMKHVQSLFSFVPETERETSQILKAQFRS